jgi:hypothetical protein
MKVIVGIRLWRSVALCVFFNNSIFCVIAANCVCSVVCRGLSGGIYQIKNLQV